MTTVTEGQLVAVRPTRHVRVETYAGILLGSAVLAAALVFGTGGSSIALTALLTGVLYLAAASTTTALVEGRRAAVDRFATSFMWGCFLVALVPLVSVLALVVQNGLPDLSGNFLTHSLKGVTAFDSSGGAYHAIIGTLEQVGIATVIAVPLGMLAAIYVVEHGRGPLVPAIRFVTDVMTGVPSIVAGLFVFSFWVIALGQGFSGFAAALALSILMVPTVTRTTEVVLGLVPDSLREAALALGLPRWKTVLRVVLPAASSGITTGVVLAIARVTGETAPLLLTALNLDSINTNPFSGQQAALPTFVFGQVTQAGKNFVARAWTGALTLIVLVLLLNLVARLVARRTQLRG